MKTIILVALMTAWLIEHLLVFINSLILLGTPRKRDLQKPTPTPSLVGGGGAKCYWDNRGKGSWPSTHTCEKCTFVHVD